MTNEDLLIERFHREWADRNFGGASFDGRAVHALPMPPIPFGDANVDDNADYASGLEAGRIWELLKSNPTALYGKAIARPNHDLARLMVDNLGLNDTVEFVASPCGFWLAFMPTGAR